MYKVIFHTDELNKVTLTLNNIKNLIADLGEENLQVELVANSEAVKMFLAADKQYESQLLELNSKKVTFAACSNAMRGLGITSDELFEFVTIVTSGVGELVKKQSAGFAYIKP